MNSRNFPTTGKRVRSTFIASVLFVSTCRSITVRLSKLILIQKGLEFPKQKHINIDMFLPHVYIHIVCSQQELWLFFKLSLTATPDTYF